MNICKTSTLILLALGQNLANAGELIDESREVAADALINIEIFNGTVTITGHDEPVFHIAGELSEAAEGFDLRSSNSTVRFEENIERRSRWDWNNFGHDKAQAADLDIAIPRTSILRFEGTNTEVEVSGLSGNTEIEVVNGEIVANELAGVIRLETVNGSIDTHQLDGRISLETVNGSIDDSNSSGSRVSLSAVNGSIRSDNKGNHLTASNINGSIELELAHIDDLDVSTVGGSVDITATMNPLAHIDVSSVSGRIDLALPDATSANFHVTSAVGGRIRNELNDAEAERVNRYVNSRELDFMLNGGNGDIDLSTVSGNITLLKCSASNC